jgi:hypothetical protein
MESPAPERCLADLEVGLRWRQDQLCWPGFRPPSRICHDLARGLMARARRLRASESFGVDLAHLRGCLWRNWLRKQHPKSILAVVLTN